MLKNKELRIRRNFLKKQDPSTTSLAMSNIISEYEDKKKDGYIFYTKKISKEDGSVEYFFGSVLNKYKTDGSVSDILSEQQLQYIEEGKVIPESQQEYIEDNIYTMLVLDQEAYIPYIKQLLEKEIQDTIDLEEDKLKSQLAESLNISLTQINRYKVKYDSALKCVEDNEYSKFEAEAQERGVKVEDLVDSIIEKGKSWITENENIVLALEAKRASETIKINNINSISGLELLLEG